VALALKKRDRFCIAPQNLIEFGAVVTRKRFVDPPLPLEEVERMTTLLYHSRRLSKIYPLRGTVMRTLCEAKILEIQGVLWYDLFLAMTMRDAGVHTIVTDNIQDFHRFPFLSAVRIEEAL
jgi:predicted nucleic acid-binding protein